MCATCQLLERSIHYTSQLPARLLNDSSGQHFSLTASNINMPQGFTRRAIGALLTATALLLIWRISNYDVASLAPSSSANNQVTKSGGNPRRIAKLSMLYGNPNPLYERALRSHERHAQRWGYPMHVLEEDISEGFWNKPSYVLSLVIQELAKPPAKRCEWLM